VSDFLNLTPPEFDLSAGSQAESAKGSGALLGFGLGTGRNIYKSDELIIYTHLSLLQKCQGGGPGLPYTGSVGATAQHIVWLTSLK